MPIIKSKAFLLVFAILSLPGVLSAAETRSVNYNYSITPEPMRYVFVNGDVEKFQAHRWMKEGYVGGIREFEGQAKLPDDIDLWMEGRAIIDQNDYEGLISLKKEDRWFVNVEYQEFRKYYDGTGGVYHPFIVLRSNELDRDLYLDIGHFRVETGLLFDDFPDITFAYEREFKEGTKSRLTWAGTREGTLSRNIAPSWQEIDETTDVFEIREEYDFAGFHWHAQQRWESTEIQSLREEKSLSTNATASEKKIRQQIQNPETDIFTTVLGVERWFFKEKVFLSGAYRYSQMDNSEIESILEMNENYTITNFSNPKQIREAYATNQFNSHTWVGHLFSTWFSPITLDGKLKAELIKRDSIATYPADRLPTAAGGATPDGIIDTIEWSENDNKVERFGESASLRFTGIPRTAIYAEGEFEQVRNWLSEDLRPSSGTESFSRESIAHIFRGAGTVGAHLNPTDYFSTTFHARHREDDIRYNDIRFTDPGTSTARSVFIDGQLITTDEIATKISYRPCRFFQPSFRYQFQDRNYDTWGIPDEDNIQESEVVANIYTADLTTQVTDELSATLSFSFQDAYTTTPAKNSTSAAQAPTFNADVATWLFSAEYAIRPNLILTGFAQVSKARNFNDFTAIGLPLGAQYSQTDGSVGLKWLPREDLTIEPKYAYYRYKPTDETEYGGYNAHVVWVDFTYRWA